MEQKQQRKYKILSFSLIGIFLLLVTFSFLGIRVWNYSMNPTGKHREEYTTATAHTIVIDDNYYVSTTSGKESKLVYKETPDSLTWDEVYSYSVDKLNWTDDYILVGAHSESSGEYSYMILDKATREKEGYANEEQFEEGKAAKGIDIEVLDKKYFDWH